MTPLKTQPTAVNALQVIRQITPEEKQQDCLTLLNMMEHITDAPPVMWGEAIIGFGSYTYRYASGHQGDWFITGFSPRKHQLTLYLMDGTAPYATLLKDLGKHKTGKSCLYIKQLSDINTDILREIITLSVSNLTTHQHNK